ncbi:GNAT family N-acetyltransferase [Pseudalkalibacillus sp. Hm43]|uniref:GNAT family N-acetyltransferase n=1 Tax=Pseudalkalibacillus sp. Hm43 TaxID=3450742 RepID=UPI003F437241
MKWKEKFSDFPSLNTDRLILREITLEDTEDLHHYASNDDVTRLVAWERHTNLSESKQFIKTFLPKYVVPWGIEHKESGAFIGTVHFVWWDEANHSAEIGYVLSQDYWGQGLITEAANAVISFGFEKLDLVRIQARCFLENDGSERVMKKLGMTYEGTVRKAMLVKGTHRDLKLYSIVK